MNTENGLTITAVTTITGLSRARIYEASELAQLGAPAHLSYRGQVVCYTPSGLKKLVASLDCLEEVYAAAALEAALAAPAPEGWLAGYEKKQEEAA